MNVLNIRMVVLRCVQTQLEAIAALVTLAITLQVIITCVMVRQDKLVQPKHTIIVIFRHKRVYGRSS